MKLHYCVVFCCAVSSQLFTSLNQSCASCEQSCTSGKQLSFRCTGSGVGSGQFTLKDSGLLAHPVNVCPQISRLSASLFVFVPSIRELLRLATFFFSIFIRQLLGCQSVFFAQLGNFCLIYRSGVLVAGHEECYSRQCCAEVSKPGHFHTAYGSSLSSRRRASISWRRRLRATSLRRRSSSSISALSSASCTRSGFHKRPYISRRELHRL